MVYTLHRINRTIDSMEDGDEETQLILEFEAAIQEQYGLQGQFVVSNGAVSRAIARAHGGDIDVGDGGRGGAVFLLRLPLALN